MAIVGEGGIGKSSLAAKLCVELVEEEKNEKPFLMEYIYWKDLRNRPDFDSVLTEIIEFTAGEQEVKIPDLLEDKIKELISIFKQSPCLIIFDNAESIRSREQNKYEEGYEKFGFFLTEVATTSHDSCLVITSREAFPEVKSSNQAKEIRVDKLDTEVIKEIFKSVECQSQLNQEFSNLDLDKDKDLEYITTHYGGNPFILTQVAEFILENYAGDLSEFRSQLKKGAYPYSKADDVLERQFERSENDEQQILYWLAIEQEAVSIDDVQRNVLPRLKPNVNAALERLNQRFLIQTTQNGLKTLQPYFREYVTRKLIKQVIEEISNPKSIDGDDLINTHSLIQAVSKEYVRESQIRLILNPVIEQLCCQLGGIEKCKNHLKLVIKKLQGSQRMQGYAEGYAGGNIINLLAKIETNLKNYDFSNLCLWQVYLRNINLYEVNFSNAQFRDAVFTEPRSTVLSIAFSYDGKLFATGDGNNNIYLSQIDSNETISLPPGHSSWVWSIAFSPNNLMLASGGEDGKVILWELQEFEEFQDIESIEPNVLGQHEGRVWSVAFSPSSKMLASGGEDGKIFLWEDIYNSKNNFIELGKHDNRVDCLVFDPSGRSLVSVGSDGFISVWSIANRREELKLGDGKNRLRSVTFIDSNTIVTGGDDGVVRIWNLETQKCLAETNKHPKCIWSVAYNPQDKIIASSSDDGIIRLWKIEKNNSEAIDLKKLPFLRGHKDRVWNIVFNLETRTLASTSEDQTVIFWQIDEGDKYQCEKVFQGYSNWIHSICFSYDGLRLASSSNDNKIRIWDINTGSCSKTLEANIRWDSSIDFRPDNNVLAYGSHDHVIYFWDLKEGTKFKPFREHTNWVRSLAFSPNGEYLASGGDDTTIKLINAKTQRPIKTLREHKQWIWSVIFIDNQRLASCGDDRRIIIWDVKKDRPIEVLEEHTGRLRSLAYSNGILASAGEDKVIKLWDTNTYKISKQFPQTDSSFIWAVALSPDGKMCASGDEQGIFRLWNIETEEIVYEEPLHGSNIIRSIKFHHTNSSVVATCGEDGKIKILNIKNINSPEIRTLPIPKPYEGTNFSGVTGLTPAQKNLLITLGAIWDE